MKKQWWVMMVLVAGTILAVNAGVAHASLSGSWSAEERMSHANWDNSIINGPFQANITDNSGRIVISVTTETDGQYDFAGDQNGSRVTGTLTHRSGGMGTFESPFAGEINASENHLVLRSDYIWTYNGKQGRWNKNYEIKESWVFTR